MENEIRAHRDGLVASLGVVAGQAIAAGHVICTVEAGGDTRLTCSALSAGEPLAGTATTAQRFLMLEHRGRWGRDALEDTPLEPSDDEVAAAFDGRVLLIRRPDRRGGTRSCTTQT